MPVKHQSESYRTKKGVRYTCYCDAENLKKARQIKANIKAGGLKCFYESHDGYVRVFVEKK